MVQLVDNLLPVERGLQLVDGLDEDLDIPGLVRLLLPLAPAPGLGAGQGQRGGVVQAGVGPGGGSEQRAESRRRWQMQETLNP